MGEGELYMPILFKCPQCGTTYRVPDHLAGKAARCRHCRTVSRIAAVGAVQKAGEAAGEVRHDIEEAAEHDLHHAGGAGAGDDILEAVREEQRAAASTSSAPAVADRPAEPAAGTAVPVTRAERLPESGPSPVLSWRMQLAACAAGLLAAVVVLAILLPWRRWVSPPRTQASGASAGAAAIRPPHHSAADAFAGSAAADAGHARYLQCVANLERLGRALRLYAELNRGQFPYELGRLATFKHPSFPPVPVECFVCPATGTKPPQNLSGDQLVHWIARNGDYVYRGAGWGPGVGAIPPILIHEKWESDRDEGVNVLDDQFNVRFMSLADVQAALRQQQKHVARRVAAGE